MRIKRAAAALGALAIGGGLVIVTAGTSPAHAGVPVPIWNIDMPTAPIQIIEGNSGTTDLTFDLVNPVPGPACNVRVATSFVPDLATPGQPPSATSGSDYVPFTQTISLPAAATSVPVTVKIVGDTVPEPDESILLILSTQGLSNPCNIGTNQWTTAGFGEVLAGLLGYNAATTDFGWAEILDEDAPELTLTMQPTIDRCEAALPGHVATAHLVLNRPLEPGETLSFDIGTINGTAASPGDFANTQEHVDLAYGDVDPISGDPITDIELDVPIVDDFVPETTESFKVILTNVVYDGSNGSLVVDGSQTILLENDDVVGNEISVSDPVVTEGTGGTTTMTFVVSSLAPSICEDGLELHVHTEDGTATEGDDYTGFDGTINIPFEASETTVSIDIDTDSNIEADETLALVVDGPAGVQGDLEGIGTIIDDDFPTVDVIETSVSEGDSGTTNMTFTLQLSDTPKKDASVEYFTTNGSALNGADYIGASGVATFDADGPTTTTVTIEVKGDVFAENDEHFNLNIESLVNLEAGDLSGRGVILNDDIWHASINDASVVEGNPPTNPTVQLTITLDAPAPPEGIDVCWETTSGTAVAGSDFVGDNDCEFFDAGETTATVTLTVLADEVHEDTEDFDVDLVDGYLDESHDCIYTDLNGSTTVCGYFDEDGSVDPSNATGTVTITDDDPEDLPETGSNTGLMLTFGLGLLGAGMILMGARKRRSTIS